MPILDSFTVDHTKMVGAGIRIAKQIDTPRGDKITIIDLRFCTPNKEILSEKGIHTLEHLFAGFMRKYLNSADVEIIDISPMGCRTGFYMSLLGDPTYLKIKYAWTHSMLDVLEVKKKKDIPELNRYQCGTYKMHSLKEAKKIARVVLNREIKELNNKDLKLDTDKIKG